MTMPVSFEHLIIYAIVAVVLFFLGRRFFCSIRDSGKCSKNCSCGKGEIRRDPVIADYLKKSGKS